MSVATSWSNAHDCVPGTATSQDREPSGWSRRSTVTVAVGVPGRPVGWPSS
jgi:hypothetical protein